MSRVAISSFPRWVPEAEHPICPPWAEEGRPGRPGQQLRPARPPFVQASHPDLSWAGLSRLLGQTGSSRVTGEWWSLGPPPLPCRPGHRQRCSCVDRLCSSRQDGSRSPGLHPKLHVQRQGQEVPPTPRLPLRPTNAASRGAVSRRESSRLGAWRTTATQETLSTIILRVGGAWGAVGGACSSPPRAASSSPPWGQRAEVK